MINSELLRKIKQIEIHTKKIVSSMLLGAKRSIYKGTGFEFDQIREYQGGDDIRFIDWKSSARMNKMLVRQYKEEHSRTILLVVDVSASGRCGSTQSSKYDVISQLASICALVGQYENDRVGLVLYADTVVQTIAPQKIKYQAHAIMKALFECPLRSEGSNLGRALEYVMRTYRQPSAVFIISDFIVSDFSHQLGILSRKHEVMAFHCYDETEQQMPTGGILLCYDPETKTEAFLPLQSSLNKALALKKKELHQLFKRYGVSYLDIPVGTEYINNLISFFARK